MSWKFCIALTFFHYQCNIDRIDLRYISSSKKSCEIKNFNQKLPRIHFFYQPLAKLITEPVFEYNQSIKCQCKVFLMKTKNHWSVNRFILCFLFLFCWITPTRLKEIYIKNIQNIRIILISEREKFGVSETKNKETRSNKFWENYWNDEEI